MQLIGKSCMTCQVFQCKDANCGHFYHPKCVAELLHPDRKSVPPFLSSVLLRDWNSFALCIIATCAMERIRMTRACNLQYPGTAQLHTTGSACPGCHLCCISGCLAPFLLISADYTQIFYVSICICFTVISLWKRRMVPFKGHGMASFVIEFWCTARMLILAPLSVIPIFSCVLSTTLSTPTTTMTDTNKKTRPVGEWPAPRYYTKKKHSHTCRENPTNPVSTQHPPIHRGSLPDTDTNKLLNLFQEACWDRTRARNSHDETNHLSWCWWYFCGSTCWMCT
jgi:hypothetical protein